MVRAFDSYAALSCGIEVLLTLTGVSIAIPRRANGNSMARRSFAKTEQLLPDRLFSSSHTHKMNWCLCIFTRHITPPNSSRARDALAFKWWMHYYILSGEWLITRQRSTNFCDNNVHFSSYRGSTSLFALLRDWHRSVIAADHRTQKSECWSPVLLTILVYLHLYVILYYWS